jgi:hypothetical protein
VRNPLRSLTDSATEVVIDFTHPDAVVDRSTSTFLADSDVARTQTSLIFEHLRGGAPL